MPRLQVMSLTDRLHDAQDRRALQSDIPAPGSPSRSSGLRRMGSLPARLLSPLGSPRRAMSFSEGGASPLNPNVERLTDEWLQIQHHAEDLAAQVR